MSLEALGSQDLVNALARIGKAGEQGAKSKIAGEKIFPGQ
jgi:hypothetical protein